VPTLACRESEDIPHMDYVGNILSELPRVRLPRRSVNKGMKREGRSPDKELQPSSRYFPDRLLAHRWVRAPVRGAVPERALGEVLRAHYIATLDAHAKHVRVVLFAIAGCACHSDPALPF
jgi:hypothetical protein